MMKVSGWWLIAIVLTFVELEQRSVDHGSDIAASQKKK